MWSSIWVQISQRIRNVSDVTQGLSVEYGKGDSNDGYSLNHLPTVNFSSARVGLDRTSDNLARPLSNEKRLGYRYQAVSSHDHVPDQRMASGYHHNFGGSLSDLVTDGEE